MNFKIPTTKITNIAFRRTEAANEQKNITSSPNSPNVLERTPNKDSFELSIGYINDTHGQTNNMMRILSGLKGDLRLSAGDNSIGNEENVKEHKVAYLFLNKAGVAATAIGNHEMDTTQEELVNSLNIFEGSALSVNLKKDMLEDEDPNDVEKFRRAHLEEKLQSSKIVEVKGEKIGIIGASPIDMFERLSHKDYHTDCHVDELEDTLDDIQDEIDNLKKQGVNKIILLSHLGHKNDQFISQNTDGIDIIIGGHTHELIEGITEGKNLLYSKSGEPVIITEAGKDGKYFGELNVSFDKDGILTKVQNNIGNTGSFPKNMIDQYMFDEILGEAEQVGYIKQAPLPPASLLEENPHANFVCDVMKEEMGADISVWNNGGIRNFFHEGSIDSRDIKDIAPFGDKMSLAEVSEKTLVEAFKSAISTTCSSHGHKPGLLAVSGLNYTVNTKEGTLKAMNFVDKNGKETPIDINNPRGDKMYKVATDEYMMSEGADYAILAPREKCLKTLPYDKDVLVCNYIKKLNKPVVINQTGRIKYEG